MLETWAEALNFMYHRANWEVAPAGTPVAFKLDRVRAVLRELGDPHRSWPAVHIGGTNGKGSTAAMVATVLRQAGYRVGLYTSPHLHTVRERIQVDGAPISEAAVLAWLNAHQALLQAHAGLTTFEGLTAMGFAYFAAREVDVAVVEVGLGGRLDTTNVVEPVVSVLTPIGLDHMAVLGDTLAQIAADKAGIFRADVPAVTAPQEPEAAAVIEHAAVSVGTPLLRVAGDVRSTAGAPLPLGQSLDVTVRWAGEVATYPLAMTLGGVYQATNAATAVAALDVLRHAGWAITPDIVAAGLASTRWPARFECLGDGPTLVVDAAHNPHGAAALVAAVAERFPGRRRFLILGLSRDKDGDGMLACLLPGTEQVLTAQADHPRAMAADDVAGMVRARGGVATAERSPAAALRHARALAGSDDVIIATGSLFLAAAVREAWAATGAMPMPPRDPKLPR
jgi:dihydrofolate synthase/folylpolyglutamate synthase